MVCDHLRLVNRHEIDDFSHTLRRHEASDEHRSIWEIELICHIIGSLRSNLERTAAFTIKQCSEDAGGVESWATIPINRAVGGDQCRRLQIADQPMIGYLGILFHLHKPHLEYAAVTSPPYDGRRGTTCGKRCNQSMP